jgi:hypothetical protein
MRIAELTSATHPVFQARKRAANDRLMQRAKGGVPQVFR